MHNKSKIFHALKEGPATFSQVKKKTGLENGVLQHYICSKDSIQKKRGAVMLKGECKDCELRKPCETECLKKILKDDKKNQILKLLNKGLSQAEIAEKLGLTPPTISHHVNHMKDVGLIENDRPIPTAVTHERNETK